MPHVTVKAPNNLDSDLAWQERVAALCALRPAFSVNVQGVDTFGDRVIFLSVQGEGVHRLHEALLEALGKAPHGAFEGASFAPHLSLVLGWKALHVSFHEALHSARATFAQESSFQAESVWQFVKFVPGQSYEIERNFPLAGPASLPTCDR